MSTRQASLHARLLVSTSVFVLSVGSAILCLNVAGLNLSFRLIVGSATLILLPLSFIALLVTVWKGVTVHGMAKMEAWWWLSAPYSAAVPLTALIFHVQEADELVQVLAMLALITTGSSILWLLVILFRIGSSKNVALDGKNASMLATVVLACIFWAVGYK
jgi:hypothetical protein